MQQRGSQSPYTIKALDQSTWPAFERLAQAHNGVWGGCWCTYFHRGGAMEKQPDENNHDYKKRLVQSGRAHAALVFDGDEAVAWCQYGTPAELPNIYHKQQYQQGLVGLPDWRITCFFVHKAHRRRGVAALALQGALDLIAHAGGGRVEAYPQDTHGQKISASFLYNSTLDMFLRAGFTLERPKGKSHCVAYKLVQQLRNDLG